MPEGASKGEPSALDRGADGSSLLPLESRDLVVRRNGRTLIDHLSLRFDGSGLTVLMGPNGAGKSLLLRVLANLVIADEGTVLWGGRAPDRARAPRLGFVFQKPVVLRRSVHANLLYPLKKSGLGRGPARRRADEALRRAGLEAVGDSPARVLSGGEQQRLALARAMALEPEILFLDEPTTNLDPTATAAIEALVREAAAAGTRVVFVTHDPAQARRLADDVIFLDRGRMEEWSPAGQFFREPRSSRARDYLEGRLTP